MDRGAWRATVQWGRRDTTEAPYMHAYTQDFWNCTSRKKKLLTQASPGPK